LLAVSRRHRIQQQIDDNGGFHVADGGVVTITASRLPGTIMLSNTPFSCACFSSPQSSWWWLFSSFSFGERQYSGWCFFW
jgi:hypothetical protein